MCSLLPYTTPSIRYVFCVGLVCPRTHLPRLERSHATSPRQEGAGGIPLDNMPHLTSPHFCLESYVLKKTETTKAHRTALHRTAQPMYRLGSILVALTSAPLTGWSPVTICDSRLHLPHSLASRKYVVQPTCLAPTRLMTARRSQVRVGDRWWVVCNCQGASGQERFR